MKPLEKMIPYCGNCSRKIKKEGMSKDEYYCDVLIDTPMKGVVTIDTDGTRCVELGVYKPLLQQTKVIKNNGTIMDNYINLQI